MDIHLHICYINRYPVRCCVIPRRDKYWLAFRCSRFSMRTQEGCTDEYYKEVLERTAFKYFHKNL